MIYSEANKEDIWRDLNITPQQIQELMSLCQFKLNPLLEKSGVNEVDLKKDYNKIDRYMSKSTSQNMIRTIETYATQASIVIKRKGLNSSSMKELDVIMSKAFEDMARDMDVSDNAMLKFKHYDANKIRKSFKLTMYCYFLNTFFNILLSILLGGIVGYVLTTTVVAPIIEESTKRIAVTGGYGTEYAIVFNSFEFSLYVSGNGDVSGIVAIRLVCVGMHLITFVINWFVNNTSLLDRLGLNKEKDKEEIQNTGFILGIIIHSIWNAGFGGVVIQLLGLAD